MIEMSLTVCIDAPVEEVWAVLSELEAIPRWVPAIHHAHCEGQKRGVGTVRVCELKQATVTEKLVEWDEGRSFRYQGSGAPMMKAASNRWSVEAHGPGQTLVTSLAEAELKGGPLACLLEPLAKIAFQRLGARSLASLKYLVEHGHPYAGAPRALPLAPAGC